MRIQFNYHVLSQEANLYFQVRLLLPCSLATTDEKHLHNQLGNLPLLPLEQFFLTRGHFSVHLLGQHDPNSCLWFTTGLRALFLPSWSENSTLLGFRLQTRRDRGSILAQFIPKLYGAPVPCFYTQAFRESSRNRPCIRHHLLPAQCLKIPR